MIQLFQYQPGRLEIKPGTAVTWVNQDEIQHTVTLGTPENRNGAVSLPLPGKGARPNPHPMTLRANSG
jgi:plastocyanin